MKMSKDKKELDATIQTELGIDISKYRDDEVGGNLLDLMLFPKSLLKWMLKPILLCMLLFLIGFLVIDLVHFQYLIYGVAGFLLFLLLGIFLGVLNVSKQLREDMTSITDYSLGVMKNALLDVKDLGDKVNSQNRSSVLSMLFKGVIILVTVPMLKNAIDKKIPIGKPIVKKMLGGSLLLLANRMKFDPDKIDETTIKIDDEEQKISGVIQSIDKFKGSISTIIKKVLGIVSTPFKLIFYILLIILVFLIYFLW